MKKTFVKFVFSLGFEGKVYVFLRGGVFVISTQQFQVRVSAILTFTLKHSALRRTA